MIVQDGEGNFRCDTKIVGDLENEDIFLFTGAFRQDTDKGIVVVCGQEYLHTYNEKDHTFTTERRLE